jgi:hypothetical protein
MRRKAWRHFWRSARHVGAGSREIPSGTDVRAVPLQLDALRFHQPLWLKHNPPIPHEEVLVEFGLTMADWDKMGQEPLSEEIPRHNG